MNPDLHCLMEAILEELLASWLLGPGLSHTICLDINLLYNLQPQLDYRNRVATLLNEVHSI